MKKIAIIGGGIIGLTLANYLDTEKFAITIYDDNIGQATKASAGIISPWLSKRRNQKWYRLAREGAAFFPQLVQDFHLDKTIYDNCGTLILRPDTALQELADLAQERKKTAPEIGKIKLLTTKETTELFPLLKPQNALFISGGGRLDGAAYLKKLRKIGKSKGIVFHEEKAAVSQNDQKWLVKTHHETTVFDYIALTPGPHITALLKDLGYTCNVLPQKGELLVFDTNFETTNQWPVAVLDGEADLIPFPNGQIVLGATHDKTTGWDLTQTPAAYNHLTENARPFLKNPNDLFQAPHQIRVGTRAYTNDFAPFFGPLKDNETLVVASGLGSSGLTTGPYIGYLLAQYFNTGVSAIENYQKPLENYIKNEAMT